LIKAFRNGGKCSKNLDGNSPFPILATVQVFNQLTYFLRAALAALALPLSNTNMRTELRSPLFRSS